MMLTSNYDSFWGMASKLWSQSAYFNNLLAEMFKLRLEQAFTERDIKTPYKSDDKKKVPMPRTLSEIVSLIGANIFSEKNPIATANLLAILRSVITDSQLHFEALEVEHIFHCLLLAIQEIKDENILIIVKDFYTKLISRMTLGQRLKLLEVIKTTLEKKQLAMARETVE